MTDDSAPQALKPLHADASLIELKLKTYEQLSTEVLKASLAPGHARCLKTRPDGTILDGHHRIQVLRDRGEDVDSLPREIVDRAGGEADA